MSALWTVSISVLHIVIITSSLDSNWQESHRVSCNCTVVQQADASDNQQYNVKYFNLTDVSYLKKENLTNYGITSQSKFYDLPHKYVLYLKSRISLYICVQGVINCCHIMTEG